MSDAVDSDIKDVTLLVEPVLVEMGFELVDVQYLSEHGKMVLRIYADRDGGITLDDCALLSREIADLLDVKDIVQHEYVLEVSSPGLNRPLKREKDFLSAVGRKVKIKMVRSLDGQRNFTGKLRVFQDGILHIETVKDLFLLRWQDVEKANIVYEFEN
ncbi:MAG: ribosome maturation factor RimP [Thermodesulfobacteriota bacterium]|nr:ribosome maturation factor RimP [Thermodesulfobacteriota bacterium]